MSLLAKELIHSLNSDAENWKEEVISAYWCVSHKGGIVVRTEGGWPFINMYLPHRSSLSLLDKWRLGKAIKQWRNRSLVLSKLTR